MNYRQHRPDCACFECYSHRKSPFATRLHTTVLQCTLCRRWFQFTATDPLSANDQLICALCSGASLPVSTCGLCGAEFVDAFAGAKCPACEGALS